MVKRFTGSDELDELDELDEEAGTFEDVAVPLLEAAGDEEVAPPQPANAPDRRISVRAFSEFFMILPS
jgi:hypothetical protein